jgi:hypothetical protein
MLLSKRDCSRLMCMAGVVAPMVVVPTTMVLAQDSTTIPVDPPIAVDYTPNNDLDLAIQQADMPVIREYKDFNAWFGENRDEATLSALGKTVGTDWFVHPVSDCQNGIPAGTSVVLFTSNGWGESSTTVAQNDPACQQSLNNFLKGGGVLIVDMGDNDFEGGFIAPGAKGTPDLVFPDSCTDATLALAAHPMYTAEVAWNNDNIDMQDSCWHNHGNLAQGMTLPDGATTLMTASYSEVQQPILAEYCYNGGRVILDTLTKEFTGQAPSGNGPSNFLLNLFSYALSPDAACNQSPVADAGPDQSAIQGDEVCFDGSGSSDADDDTLTYLWTFTAWPAGSTVALDNPTSDKPCFMADQPGTYKVSLIVNDGTVDSAPSTAEAEVISYREAINQLCPCDGPKGTTDKWKNHGQYVSCVSKSAESFLEDGRISEAEKDAICSEAGQSTCGGKK